MASRGIKLLALFTLTLVVSFTNFIYSWYSLVPLSKIQRINLNRRHLNSESECIRSESNHKIPAIKAIKILRTKFTYAGEIRRNPGDKSQNRPYRVLGFMNIFGDKVRKNKYVLRSYCPDKHPYLGPTDYKNAAKPIVLDKVFSLLDTGGSFQPFDCVPRDTVAVIIPFSGRGGPLPLFLFSLHVLLLAQLVEYQIFVVKEHEDTNIVPFKPGLLSNIGFLEAQKLRPDSNFTCVVFHDPYLAPTDSRNLYRCSNQPKHLVASVDKIRYKQELGGVIAIRPEDFRAVNGFSNSYTDSESVYLDMYDRLMAANYAIVQPTPTYANYDSIPGLTEVASQKPRASTKITTNQDPLFTLNAITAFSTLYWEDDGLASLSDLSYLLKIYKNIKAYTLIELYSSPGPFPAVTKSSVMTVTENIPDTIATTPTETVVKR